jgi:gliding motility-associated-like protein
MCDSQYQLVRHYTFTDACGNASSASLEVSVVDTVGPVWSGTLDTLWLSCGEGVADGATEGVAFADCDSGWEWSWGEMVDLDGDSGVPACAGGTGALQPLLASDGCGNSGTHVVPVVWMDADPPVLNALLESLEVSCGADFPDHSLDFSDACDPNITVSFTDSLWEDNCAGGIWLRMYTATDACGNALHASQTLTRTDTIAPTFSFTPADTLALNFGCLMGAAGPWPEATDDCSTLTYTQTVDTLWGACSGNWTEWHVYTATDGCENTSTLQQVVTVTLEEAPQWGGDVWPDTLSCAEDVNGWTPGWIPVDCLPLSESGISWTDSLVPGPCPQTYDLFRTFTLWDACGNQRDSTWAVAVVDSIPPVIEGIPADLEWSCAQAVPACDPGALTATDACGPVSVGCADVPSGVFSCTGLETIYRVYTATDACGNGVEHVQTIAFVDTIPPALTAVPEDFGWDCRLDVPEADVSGFAVTGGCPSDATFTVEWTGDDWISGDCEDFVERTYAITDACGQVTLHVQAIALIDSVPPFLLEPLPSPTYVCWESFLPCTDFFPLFFDSCQTYSWTCTDQVLNGDCATNDCDILQSYVVTDACGNSATFETLAQVGGYGAATPLLPTGFSPNEDGFNDTYRILGIGLDPEEEACNWMDPNTFVVFNRWGNEVYRESDYRNTWRGTNVSGVDLPNGTYFVLFQFRGQEYNTYVDLRR